MTRRHNNIVGLDAAILMNPKVWQASGHLTAGFADELVECKKCHKRFRLDEVNRGSPPVSCPECGGELMEPRKFNLMMRTFVGSLEEEAAVAYLRAETCQGIYVNFENVINSTRLSVPFGIAQIGKAFRNEITPKDFIFRTREFEQMEMQWFCSPSARRAAPNRRRTKREIDAENWGPDEWFEYWLNQRISWYLNLGIKKENLRTVEVPEKERAHYAKRQVDIEYKFPFGSAQSEAGSPRSAGGAGSPRCETSWKEIEGIHNRGDWDLSNHSKYSGKDLRYYDPSVNPGQVKEKYFPYIIETSVGVERSLFAFLCDAYEGVAGGRTKTTQAAKEAEILLKLNKKIVPVKAAVFPLVKNKPELVKKAKEVYQTLKPYFLCQYDETGSIGRRYRRGDEIGVLYAITIDFESLDNNDVTVRERDTMKQERIKIPDLLNFLKEELAR